MSDTPFACPELLQDSQGQDAAARGENWTRRCSASAQLEKETGTTSVLRLHLLGCTVRPHRNALETRYFCTFA